MSDPMIGRALRGGDDQIVVFPDGFPGLDGDVETVWECDDLVVMPIWPLPQGNGGLSTVRPREAKS